MPVIALMPEDEYFTKTASNLREAAARGAKIVLISSQKGKKELSDIIWHFVPMPVANDLANSFLYAVPVQMLAYYTAVHKGTDVDQPRNQAKSVTVE